MNKTILILLATAMISAGCETVNRPIEGRADPYPAAQVNFASKDLRRDTAVGTPIVQRDEISNQLVVTVPIRSAINKTLYIDYRTTFLDANGVPISQTGWLTKTLEANTPDAITATSYSARAADFQMDLRYAR